LTDSLTGARLKLRRARDHLEILGDELAAFNAGEPYRIVHEPNADSSEHIFYAKVLKEPPPFLSVIVGDALQNMRSALEHLVWGLTPQSTRATAEWTVGFPIYAKESTFVQRDKNTSSGYSTRSGMHKIWTMDLKARTAIQQLQPYKTGHDELLLLNELARVDRHQSLRMMGGANPSFTYGWRKRGTNGPFVADFSLIRDQINVTFGGPFVDGAEIGHFRFNEPEMEVQFDLPRYVAFRDEGPAKGRHVLGTLTGIRRYIERVVVPKLERYFCSQRSGTAVEGIRADKNSGYYHDMS
jgi:hypothetical protein